MAKIYCLWHGPSCNDGFIASWAVYYHLGAMCEYIPINYGQDVRGLNLEPGSVIYIVDFCPPPEQVIDLGRQHEKVVVIDHHEHACNEILSCRESLPESVILHLSADNKKSGALLTWEYFQEMLRMVGPVPNIVLAASDYDTWQFEYDYTLAYYYVLGKLPRTIESMEKLSRMTHEEILAIGQPRADAAISDMDWIINNTKRTIDYFWMLECASAYSGKVYDNFPKNHSIAMFNCPHFMVSLTMDRYLRQSGDDFAMAYFDTQTHRVFRLNSRNGYRVDALARVFGGGGHPASASFKVLRGSRMAQY